ncbi:MAG: ATP-binding cassette domain-containing protein [Candidatus Lokiarchaeota archaeon]|nr:ATP-binding cassette domain-containing protein [Candidatus Lokiarchaeota archaeon]MBD3202468.1 ATP-binding cassette domain-containing protein [Candidatus Lokiarchaeota archaeon]
MSNESVSMKIEIKGAKENNLKDINVIFDDGLTAVTGVSGSGKSSLVFNTLYYEARRKYLETFTSFSNRLRLSPANVESIHGLGPALSLEQNKLNRNPNSTLATATGIHPLLRILYARYGDRSCEECGNKISYKKSIDEIVQEIYAQVRYDNVIIYAILMINIKGSHSTLLELLNQHFSKNSILVDEKRWDGSQLNSENIHSISIELIKLAKGTEINVIRKYIQNIIGLGSLGIRLNSNEKITIISRTNICLNCGKSFPEFEPKHFHQKCPYCNGKGCTKCNKTGLHPGVNSVYFLDKTIVELLELSVKELLEEINQGYSTKTTNRIIKEITKRLELLDKVGLNYLLLNRSSPSLSRGEAQRIRLAMTLINQLENVIHVLDEPTIGQHFIDVQKFLPILEGLPGPVIYVEHDSSSVAYADRVIDLGPKAGEDGGNIIFEGTPQKLWEKNTPSGNYFSGRKTAIIPEKQKSATKFIEVIEANRHNLKNISIKIPLERLTVISGVSGSGKSTLIEEILFPSLKEKKAIGCKKITTHNLKPIIIDQDPIGKNPRSNPVTYTKISNNIRKIFADSSEFSVSHFSFNRPEGACPTCNGMGAIERKMKYLPSTWIKCSDCEGARFNDEIVSLKIKIGSKNISISELYDLSISELHHIIANDHRLENETDFQKVKKMLKIMVDIGLGYIKLGQPSPTLSGGEAQRIKLSKYLGKDKLKNQIFILDEPTTGLHPKDVSGLLKIFNKLVKNGATLVVVEHNLNVIKSADWLIDLGPESGPDGGDVVYCGHFSGFKEVKNSQTAKALNLESEVKPKNRSYRKSNSNKYIEIKNARIHNLKGIDIKFPKNQITVVTGVSGSGKSSLVVDTLQREAKKRFLETLSIYERHTISEVGENQVDTIKGLGVTTLITPEKKMQTTSFNLRLKFGEVSEIINHLSSLFSYLGTKKCPQCNSKMNRTIQWECTNCNYIEAIPKPKHFISSNYAAACRICNGVGSTQIPRPEKLIINPDKPLCKGAMYSPGFFPKGYLCKPYNGGYYVVQALASRYKFDPFSTPWNEMSKAARDAFLYGDDETLEIHYENRSGKVTVKEMDYKGFYDQWIRDWDIGGTFTEKKVCEGCLGSGLRKKYLEVRLEDKSIDEMNKMPIKELYRLLKQLKIDYSQVSDVESKLLKNNYHSIIKKLEFLIELGLGYLHLDRNAATLSAGEAQRIRLAGILGSEMRSLTVILDEPTRGMHPSEVDSLKNILIKLRDRKNTIILIEHDPSMIEMADYLVELGPKAGFKGGFITGKGKLEDFLKLDLATSNWINGEKGFQFKEHKRKSNKFMTIYKAEENNLKINELKIPLGILVGVCGVSGSGKSTLINDTIGRVLSPKKHTTSVAYEPVKPGKYEKIEGKPSRTIIVDQVKEKIKSPLKYLGLKPKLEKIFSQTEEAKTKGISLKDIKRKCSVCKGRGISKIDMGFLPTIKNPCEVCSGTGYTSDIKDIRINGYNLLEITQKTVEELIDILDGYEIINRKLKVLQDVGLEYLVLDQPSHTISTGEAQRLKIAKELSKIRIQKTLFILDEPSVGLHLNDLEKLISLLNSMIQKGHSVIIIEHHPQILAICDWLIELGPGSGPTGGEIIAEGTPIVVSRKSTPTAAYIKKALGGKIL